MRKIGDPQLKVLRILLKHYPENCKARIKIQKVIDERKEEMKGPYWRRW